MKYVFISKIPKAFKFPRRSVNASTGTWKLSQPHNLPPPDCRQADWSRDNHLGNGVGGFPLMYNWTIPNIEEERCALRIRYMPVQRNHCRNISVRLDAIFLLLNSRCCLYCSSRCHFKHQSTIAFMTKTKL